MSAQRVSSRSRDSISSLPDEVLGKILSLLPTRLAASTSVLSKRWKNLLPLVDSLDLSDAIGDPRGFSAFVDTTLALLTNSSIIKRFSLNCEHKHDTTRVDTWIRTALERFSELHLESACLHGIKTESFTSNTLLKLTLSNGFFLSGLPPNGGVFFPNLKTLSLVSVGFEPCEVYEYLITGCPLLEELFIRYASPSECSWMVVNQSIAVSSPSIKRMSISYPSRDYCEPPASEVFRTPSLVYLDYSGYVAGHYHVDFTSLVEARLDLRRERVLAVEEDGVDDSSVGGWDEDVYDEAVEHNAEVHDDDIDDNDNDNDDDDDDDSDSDGEESLPDVANLVEGISNVKTLHLSPYFLEVFDICCKSMPVFHNLLTLSFESDKERGWQVVPLLLKNSPNLETLVIKGLVHQVTDKCGDACVCIAKKKKKMEEEKVCCLSTCQVKVLNISGYRGTGRELKQMRHFLGNLKCLETVKVGLVAENHHEDNSVNNHYQRITNALTKLPRASSNCQIHFF
ncbi:hypothetical protein BRARA_E01327 [Brassica rapa]|uniref:F-box domain-containing protein n=2 Tax=Brassica TaxID=3705 RepID=A0ABQ8D8V6_BRANA|nr:F-box/LRR-repeat protein At2g29930-like [Brassica napus]KAH0925798.1 hypothetical protein HID58_018054 [Brassica napus]RID62240.1 hypothetical protein BRARA_E01327 [Brassica rapa]